MDREDSGAGHCNAWPLTKDGRRFFYIGCLAGYAYREGAADGILLFFDPVHRAVGVAHGGWKGTVKKIALKTVLRMQQEFGTKPEECLVGIGPAIGPCCYEVGGDVMSRFCEAFPGQEQRLFHRQDDRVHLNLWEANRLQFMEIGVKAEHIDAADVCTACNSRLFFSYRADGGRTGRIAAVIALKKS